ncbi:MAG: NAD(P)H-dependent oxidoreductase [Prevotellaceae bacterium]|jgi:putative NADPH-quinone reductase|nr:NAD(P)H-dependent oxidoreductase [Prevotellaceae bacterium]
MVTIVFSHPWHGSFNKAILDTVTAKFDKNGTAYKVIDLAKDGFNPSFSEQDLALYKKGESTDPLVYKYQEIIRQSDEMIFIFPIWWSTMPANLKGFFDKTLLVNFSHNYQNTWTPLLKIGKTTVVTTSESPTDHFKMAIEECFIKQMLYAVGVNNATWLNCERTSSGGDEVRKAFLKRVEEQV